MKTQWYNTISVICILILSFLHKDLHAQIVPIGNGSYTTTFPGVDIAGRNGFPSGTPWVSGEAASKPIPTNDWWSDMIKTDHGGKAFNYPLSFRSLAEGLNINYTIPLVSNAIEYRQPMSDVKSIVIGTENLGEPNSTVSDHSDWSVTMNWGNQFYSTVNIGSPFVYFEKSNTAGAAKVAVNFNQAGVTTNGNKLIIQNNMNNSNYVVFAPSGSTWIGSNGVYTSTLNGKNYWSMVLLPFGVDVNTAISDYEKYAFVFPDNTRVDWDYNETNGQVRTTFTITTDVKEGSHNQILQGLLPHQWDRLSSGSPSPNGYEYHSVRGTIKTLEGNTFTVQNTFSGILPTLPDLGKYTSGFDLGALASTVDQIKNDGLAEWTDSYNQGQDMNRLVQAARIANQIGDIEARDQLINTVRVRLEDWLSAENGEVSFLFYYNSDWDALIGYPAGHRQDTNLNDHHFHWGYFIHAASAIEQFNPGWAAQWGEMINLLVRDAANPSRTDSMFPFLRNFSPYGGHSWANGFSTEPFGNDQESTSESMQFNSALIHWGTITNNKEIRDLGVYLYTTELSTIQEYWFDVEQRSFQPEYQYDMVARVWAGGYDNGTWWTNDVAASYGIQLYPIHAGSLYLGHRKDYVDRVWLEMTQNTEVLNNVPNANLWYDTYWKFLSFADPQKALDLYRAYPSRDIKVGISDTQTYHWLHTMVSLGQLANEITADYPIAAAFRSNETTTYVAHNYGNSPITVRFSDGYSLNVPSNSMATSRDIEVQVILQTNTLEIPSGGNVDLTATVTGAGVTKVEFYANETLLGTDTTAPYTINSGALPAGFPKVYAKAFVGNNFNLSNSIGIQVGSQLAYQGTLMTIPGTIESGHFDVFEGGNGQGITYSDNTAYNEGNFRQDEGVDANTDDNEGATVGWIDPGEWLEYTVNVNNPGLYKITMRYASGNTNGGGPFWFEQEGSKISDDITVPFTGTDWNVWQDVVTEDVNLVAGEQVIRVRVGEGGFNLGRMTFEYTGPSDDRVLSSIQITPENSIINIGQSQQFSAQGYDQFGDLFASSFNWSSSGGTIDQNGLFSSSDSGVYTIIAASGGISANVQVTVNSLATGIVIPGVIEAENYKDGGEGIGYSDVDAGNTGGAYRNDNVDIEVTGDSAGGHNVGWIEAGEWLAYNIDATAGSQRYNIDFRVASPSGGGSFHLELDGVSITDIITVPITGNWQSYTTVTVNDISISSGIRELRLVFDSNGFNINYVEFKEKVTGNNECSGISSNEQYRFTISSDSQNPSITFIPEISGVGDNICILYYGTSPSGSYPGYIVTPGQPYQINAILGQTIYFYYTYSLPTGGENNTFNMRNEFTVGNCNSVKQLNNIDQEEKLSQISVYPNPAHKTITLSNLNNIQDVKVFDVTGKLFIHKILKTNTSNLSINVDELPKGMYLLSVFGDKKREVYKILKM
ncbi:glycosyl hydrolase [Aquimarina sp. D1M17]|uniref:glycosyl hydrolase n=1 Tax=Aquimarina acroporae TaxID=2937283 RepID=UPI0020BE03CD|nr:glycosyl hydrolase [Aquimarina acroporae]MCK8521298.1 glycosyl hydrolase [Aquimarina acroporae]